MMAQPAAVARLYGMVGIAGFFQRLNAKNCKTLESVNSSAIHNLVPTPHVAVTQLETCASTTSVANTSTIRSCVTRKGQTFLVICSRRKNVTVSLVVSSIVAHVCPVGIVSNFSHIIAKFFQLLNVHKLPRASERMTWEVILCVKARDAQTLT